MKKLTKLTIILAIVSVLVSNLYTVPQIKVWQKNYGGSNYDQAKAITPTKDGGFIVAGYTNSFSNGETDVYLIKIDKNGNKVWQKNYGGSNYDEAKAITPTKDGGFIVVGYTESFTNNREVYLIKIDKNGNKVWQKNYGGSDWDEAEAITPTKDGGFIVAGSTKSFANSREVYLIKIDKNGNKVWQKTYGGSGPDEAEAITPTKDGGFIVAGHTRSFGNGKTDAYLIKIDKNGNKVWQKTYGGSSFDQAEAITPTKDGGFIVAGYTSSLIKDGSFIVAAFGSAEADVYLIKIDKNGNKVWQKTYGGDNVEIGRGITPTKDGGFIVVGYMGWSFAIAKSDAYLIKIDKNGNKVWQKNYGGSENDKAEAIIPTKDGGFIVAGYTYSFSTDKFGISKPDVYLIKIKEESHLSSSKE